MSIIELDGKEAGTLGSVLAFVVRVLKEETRAERVYVYLFGGSVPHLHFHLAPHRDGDALNDQMIQGEVVSEKMASGVERLIGRQFPPLPEHEQRAAAKRVENRLKRE